MGQMTQSTLAILALADTLVKGGRQALIQDLADELSARRYLTTEDVADRYSVSKACVKKWRETGILIPSLRVTNGTVRYSLADLQKFEAANGKEVKGK